MNHALAEIYQSFTRFVGHMSMSSKNWFGPVNGCSLLDQMSSRNLSTSSVEYVESSNSYSFTRSNVHSTSIFPEKHWYTWSQLYIMKRKFKKWWSTIPLISTYVYLVTTEDWCTSISFHQLNLLPWCDWYVIESGIIDPQFP